MLSAAPIPDPPLERRRERVILEGDLPSPVNPPRGCNFGSCWKFGEMGQNKVKSTPRKEFPKACLTVEENIQKKTIHLFTDMSQKRNKHKAKLQSLLAPDPKGFLKPFRVSIR